MTVAARLTRPTSQRYCKALLSRPDLYNSLSLQMLLEITRDIDTGIFNDEGIRIKFTDQPPQPRCLILVHNYIKNIYIISAESAFSFPSRHRSAEFPDDAFFQGLYILLCDDMKFHLDVLRIEPVKRIGCDKRGKKRIDRMSIG